MGREGDKGTRQEDEMLDGITNLMDMSLNKLMKPDHAAVHGVTKSWSQLSD